MNPINNQSITQMQAPLVMNETMPLYDFIKGECDIHSGVKTALNDSNPSSIGGSINVNTLIGSRIDFVDTDSIKSTDRISVKDFGIASGF